MHYYHHHYEQRQDPRIARLIRPDEMSWEGYGIYNAIEEEIRKCHGSVPLSTLLRLSNLRTQRPKILRVLTGYRLFHIDENDIVSLLPLELPSSDDDPRQTSIDFENL